MASRVDRVQQAQGLIKMRQQSRLRNLDLAEARIRLKLENAAGEKAWCDAQSDKCCELTDQLGKK